MVDVMPAMLDTITDAANSVTSKVNSILNNQLGHDSDEKLAGILWTLYQNGQIGCEYVIVFHEHNIRIIHSTESTEADAENFSAVADLILPHDDWEVTEAGAVNFGEAEDVEDTVMFEDF